YTEMKWSGAQPGLVMPTKGTPSGFFYRLAYDGVGSTVNTIAFDQTDPDPATSVTVDFDFRLGRPGTGDHPADGMGFALLNTAVKTDPNSATAAPLYDVTGPGPQLNEDIAAQYSVGVGLNTFQNSFTEGNTVNGGFNDASDNSMRIGFNGVIN